MAYSVWGKGFIIISFYEQEPTMHFSDLNWIQVEEYLKKDDQMMLVIGSTEQPVYLSLLTDTKIPLALAEAAGKETGVLIAPTVNFGWGIGWHGQYRETTGNISPIYSEDISVEWIPAIPTL